MDVPLAEKIRVVPVRSTIRKGPLCRTEEVVASVSNVMISPLAACATPSRVPNWRDVIGLVDVVFTTCPEYVQRIWEGESVFVAGFWAKLTIERDRAAAAHNRILRNASSNLNGCEAGYHQGAVSGAGSHVRPAFRLSDPRDLNLSQTPI